MVSARLVRDKENMNKNLQVEFKPTTAASFFPTFVGTLDVYPAECSSDSDLVGSYEPPFGKIGLAIDKTIGYLIAQRSMTNFVSQLAEQLQALPIDHSLTMPNTNSRALSQ